MPRYLASQGVPMLKYKAVDSSLSPSNLRVSIEQLFLLKRFEQALQLSYRALLDLSEDRDSKAKGKSKQCCTIKADTLARELLNLRHRCNTPENCECVPIVTLLVQILYEMGRSQDVIPAVSNFYGDMLKTPYDILFLCINLLVNALNDYMAAKRILLLVLDARQTTDSIQEYRYDLTEDQREVLVELLIFHVMAPLEELKEAMQYLETDHLLPEWKREGWLDYIKSTIEQNTKNKLDKNKQEAGPLIRGGQVSNSIASQVNSLVAKSKNILNYFFFLFRKSYQTRLGMLAYSVVVLVTFVMAFKGRSAPSQVSTEAGRAIAKKNNNSDNNTKRSAFAGVVALISEAFTFK